MTRVALRQYNHEIESLIERGQLDEAVAHSKHILQTYPKYLETYRLLGKAYLESQRFGEAADIFQRVLASIPDDFVSNIGMSIIREDEGNLDAAIWHMERAFEAQPANATVQDELRRLFGRRDGLEPPKVRLTRPALARMYARGNLYHQAIAEIRSATSDEPNRLDLKVLMARMSFLSGQRVKATEQCSEILLKFPYCYEANRILAAILPGTTRAEDAAAYQQRVISLDPYAAYLTLEQAEPANVPDNAVVIDRLEYQPPQRGLTSQPQWASSLGIDLGQTETTRDEPLPDWMTGDQPSQQPEFGQFGSSEQETAPAVPFMDDQPAEPAAELPDWMQAAGWQNSTGEGTEQPIDFEDAASAGEGEIAPGEIPDWLKSIAPQGVEEAASAQSSAGEDLSAFEGLFGGEAKPSLPEADLSGEMPDWLKDESQAADQTTGETPVPDWLPAASDQPAALEGDMPDWLRDLAPSAEVPASTIAGALAFEAPEQSAAVEPQLAASDAGDLAQGELPDWLSEVQQPEGLPAETPAANDLNWLQDLNTAEDLPEAEALQSTNLPLEEAVPSVEMAPTGEEPAATEPVTSLEETPAQEAVSEIMPFEINAANVDAVEAESIEALPAEGLPDWLVGLALGETEVASQAPQTVEQPAESVEEGPSSESVQPALEQHPAAADADSTMAWLEALAAKQGALEEELFVKPEERVETPPDWINQASQETLVVVEQPEIAAGSVLSEETVAELPAEVILNEALTQDEAELPSAAAESIQPQAAATLQEEAALPSLEPVPGETEMGLAWLESLAAKQGALEEELFVKPEDRVETPPEWTQEAALAPELEVESEQPTNGHEPEAAPAQFEALGEQPASDEQVVYEVEANTVILPETTQEEPNVVPLPVIQTEPSAVEEESEAPTQPVRIFPVEAAAPTETTASELESSAAEAEPAMEIAGEDSAMAWLESLAAKQGALEEELFVKPEERVETPPEWVSQAQEEAPAPEPAEPHSPLEDVFASDQFGVPQTPESPVEAEKPLSAEEAMPFAAAVFGPDSTVERQESQPLPEEEALPDWLKGMEEEVAEAESQAEPVAWQPEETAPSAQAQPSEWTAEAPVEKPGFESAEDDLPAMPAEFTGMADTADTSSRQDEDFSAAFETVPSNLSEAHQALQDGMVPQAISAYNQMISEGQSLDEIIHDLRDALYHYPVDVTIWQALGDAYIRSNQLQEGLDAYTKAEELLR